MSQNFPDKKDQLLKICKKKFWLIFICFADINILSDAILFFKEILLLSQEKRDILNGRKE